MSKEIAAIRDVDLQMAELYKDFLPKKIFDTHVHMYIGDAAPAFYGPNGNFFREKVVPEDYWEDLKMILPGVEDFRLNMMPMVDRVFNDLPLGMRDKANKYVADLAQKDPRHVASAYVMYHDDVDKIREMASSPGVRGLKCYYFTPRDKVDPNAAISDFLPEAAWIVASEKKIPIILHLMRPSGLSDPENFAYIMDMTAKYPDAPLVLAHCARGFVSWTAVEQIRKIVNRDNVWFDLAAVCEVGPMMASIMQNAGKRVMWGTDWPICLHRGRAVSMGMSQEWFAETVNKKTGYALLVAESLHAFHQTASLMNLDQTQIDDIFYNNAVTLFCDK
jgi:predicted TIM-barrel fold metal-dependent hydrolase